MATTKKTAGAAARRTTLLIATRKGLWTLAADAARRTWKLSGPTFLGHIVHHAMADPRDGRTILAAARTGHLGPTIFRSTDRGRTWKEATTPPAFKPDSGRTVDHSFWLTPGHATEPGVWYVGTSPQGLFRSPMAARPGQVSTASTSTRTGRPGAAAIRTAHPTGRSSIPC
jgi:hypothetical protein